MPGFSQLKKFSEDILSLGDESTLRATRGERLVRFEIPNTIEDKDDSEDFVLGMPEIVAEVVDTQIDDDLSDIMGISSSDSSTEDSSAENVGPSFEAPDMSNLLNPIGIDENTSEDDMPDLSMFMEPEDVEPEEDFEQEPEEVSIADMGLEALLASSGFDEPEESEDFEEEEDEYSDEFMAEYGPKLDNLDSNDNYDELPSLSPVTDNFEDELAPVEELGDFDEVEEVLDNVEAEAISEIDEQGDLEIAGDFSETFEMPESTDFADIDVDAALGDLDSLGDLGDLGEIGDLGDIENLGETSEPVINDFAENDFEIAEPSDINTEDNFDLDVPVEPVEEKSFDLGNDFEVTESSEGLETEENVNLDDGLEVTESFDLPDLENNSFEFGNEDTFNVAEIVEGDTSFDLPDTFDNEEVGEQISGDVESFDVGESYDLPDLGTESFDIDNHLQENFVTESEGLENTNLNEDFEISENTDITKNSSDDSVGLSDDFDAILTGDLFNSSDVDLPSFDENANAFDEVPDTFESDSLNLEAFDDNSFETSTFEDDAENPENEPIEDFDTSEMEGLDFDIPDTDSQLENTGSDFALGSSGEFPMEGSFEIPGFSDVETAKEEKTVTKLVTGKTKKTKKVELDEPDFEGAVESEELPPNTLSDAQYRKFLQNLSEYPLNVRLAFEDLIAQDEFTDDAEFEIIEKILQKAPARQVASTLEKMLDISIPVPRDFEHRTAEEYEAYKKSISYQLRNKIIPGVILFASLVLVSIGLFNFGKNCIYRPLKANSLYKQGYALLQATEYPQSEMKFEEAAGIRLNKKWFYKYARGYRQHKQYKRAEKMYKNILYCFRHDKEAGLEYAGMELNDLANYEKAEEIVRREVLDYHINDADGILLLGDVFLEWGTEKDSSKLENAREQYATLIQLYKSNDLYLSRMMRYFIRTDNLREVLKLKQTFEPREKSLGWEDWTELSGYLLDKYYGPIAPSDEYLRYQIEGLRKLLFIAAKSNPNNPIALYNLSRYFVQTNESQSIENTLKDCIEKFNALDSIKRRDIYKYIDSYRLLGEYYIDTQDYLQALEQFAEGIHLYTTERDNAGFEGNKQIGKLYEDFANIKYFVAGDYDEALINFKNAVQLENDTPGIRYKIGYIQYKNKNYLEALGSFMKAGEGNQKERNLLLAMANTLSMRGDDYAAEGYYEHLLNNLDVEIADRGIVFPQASEKEYEIVNTYLYAANNYGVTLYRLAKRTGNSGLNAQAMVQFSQSIRAWDALTRNQETLVRLEGSNLAAQNMKYITSRVPDFEPAIYIDIKKTLTDKESF